MPFRVALGLLTSALASPVGPGRAEEAENLSSADSCDVLVLSDLTEGRVGADYKTRLAAAVASVPLEASPRTLAAAVLAEQRRIKGEAPLSARASLLDRSCHRLVALNEATLALLHGPGEAPAGADASGPHHALRQRLLPAARASLAELEDRLKRARFRSAGDLMRYKSRYYCFIASMLEAAHPGPSTGAKALAAYGDTRPCIELGRTSFD
ncbi:MAG: hypothetical protein AB7E80_06760 [Hyphomicrobiaceae bacterium]